MKRTNATGSRHETTAAGRENTGTSAPPSVTPSWRGGSFTELLDARRHQTFVGRREELGLMQRALDSSDWPFNLLYVHGPAGVGKSQLLGAFARACRERGVVVEQLTAAQARASALQGVPWDEGPRRVVQITCIDEERDWEPRRLLDQLTPHWLVMVESRRAPPIGWLTDPGWQDLACAVRVSNFSEEETFHYLELRGVPEAQRGWMHQVTHGHPLSLALVSSQQLCLDRDQPDRAISATSLPLLLAGLLGEIEPDRQAVLDAAAVARRSREDVLASLLDGPAKEHFRWLRTLPFMETHPDGLAPLPLVRCALLADLRWRNPTALESLRRRARARYLERLRSAAPADHDAALHDLLFTSRLDASFADLRPWTILTSDARSAATMAEIAAEIGGCQAATRVSDGLARKRDTFRLVSCEDRALGLAWSRRLDAETTSATQHARMRGHLSRERALAGSEWAAVCELWLRPSDPPDAAAFLQLVVAGEALRLPAPAVTFVATSSETCARLLQLGGAQPVPGAEPQARADNGQVWFCDWRRRSPEEWMDLLGRASSEPGAHGGGGPAPPYVVFDHEAFSDAVRRALRAYSDEHALRHNSLLASRMVVERASAEADIGRRVAVLRQLLVEAAAGLSRTPRQEKLHRALRRGYLDPAPTQERAAELLGLPLSTFRRHLKMGVKRVVDALWQVEIEGPQVARRNDLEPVEQS